MNRNLRLLFTLSLLANVLLLGVAGGFAWKHYMYKSGRAVLMKESLDQTSRQIVMKSMKESRPEIEEKIAAAKDARKDLIAVMVAEDFDETAYDNAARTLIERQTVLMESKAEVARGLFQQLPREARQKLAKKFSMVGMEGKKHFRPQKSSAMPEPASAPSDQP